MTIKHKSQKIKSGCEEGEERAAHQKIKNQHFQRWTGWHLSTNCDVKIIELYIKMIYILTSLRACPLILDYVDHVSKIYAHNYCASCNWFQ